MRSVIRSREDHRGQPSAVILDGRTAEWHTVRAVSSHIGLGYEYTLDKQTDLYAYYARVSNKNGGTNSLCAGGSCQGYDKDSGLPANYTPKSLMLGARYRF